MSYTELNKRYFNWMLDVIQYDVYVNSEESFVKLLNFLNNVTFNYIVPMDGNRYDDGINLRYRFSYEENIPDYIIANKLDLKPCSVLEMMVALSLRAEEHIMDDPDIGYRAGEWFWDMIASLGLNDMDDTNFDNDYVRNVVNDFLYRRYEPNGKGGLFTLKYPDEDLRNMEIWYQMNRYLNEKLDKENYKNG